MDKKGLVILLLFLFMTVLSRSDAFNSRKLFTDPNNSSINIANQDSPSSSPPPADKKSNLPTESTKSKDSQNNSPSNVESEGLNDANTGKKFENNKKLDKGCKGNLICNDREKTMFACIQDFENGSDKLTLVVQNERDVDLKGNITTSINNLSTPFEIPAHGTEKVNVTLSVDKNTKIILNAGNGDCMLQVSQPKSTPVNTPSKPKDPENTLNPTNINNPVDTRTNPEKVKDPEKSKEVNDLSKDKLTDTPAHPKETDDTKTPTNVDEDKMSNKVDDPPKSEKVNESSKSKDVNDPSKLKHENDPSKSKDENDTSNSKDENDPPKSKDEKNPTPKPTRISENNFLDQLTFYSKQVTPIYGAYFAFLVALIIGVSWALCSFRKRRTENVIRYQELEMGLPEASNVETVEGWDQDWDDDDWDEDKAIRSPGARIQNKNISSNGLISRATKKDGWDADWDD